MPQSTEKSAHYRIQGRVVSGPNQRGVRGVRVDAWDRDMRYPDLLGQSVTSESGAFSIDFDSRYFRDHDPERAPDLIFKLYLDQRLVLDTSNRPMANVEAGVTSVTLRLDLPESPTLAPDRVSATQLLAAVDFWRASDFKGVWSQTKERAGTLGGLAATLTGKAFDNFTLKPVRPDNLSEKAVVGQDSSAAQRALARESVQVTEVKTLDAGVANAQDLKSLRGYPLKLNAGDKVTLYTVDGKVQYYARTPEVTETSVDAQAVAQLSSDMQGLKSQVQEVQSLRQDVESMRASGKATEQRLNQEAAGVDAQGEEVAKLRAELTALRQSSSAKDVQIAQLQDDLATVRTAQDNLIQRIPLDRLAALEQQIKQLARTPAGVATSVPATPAAPTRAAGTRAQRPKKPSGG